MDSSGVNAYLELMREIKRRVHFIQVLKENRAFAVYNVTWIESICLQVRKILENVAMACLVANGDRLEQLPQDMEKMWQADLILRRLEDINPDCYPQPLVLQPKGLPQSVLEAGLPAENYRGELVDRPGSDWLTREEFREVYGRLGQILHAHNPLKGQHDIEYFVEMVPVWHDKIINLSQ